MKRILIVGLIAALAVVATTQGQYKAAEWKGKPLPQVKLTTPSGATITNKDFKGQVVVLDFFATWCGPCKRAAPVLQKMHEAHASKGLKVIGLDTWERGKNGGTPSLAEYKQITAGYQKEHGYTYTFTTANDELAKTMKVEGVPTFFIVDKKGVIRDVMVGFDEAAFSARVKSLLAEK